MRWCTCSARSAMRWCTCWARSPRGACSWLLLSLLLTLTLEAAADPPSPSSPSNSDVPTRYGSRQHDNRRSYNNGYNSFDSSPYSNGGGYGPQDPYLADFDEEWAKMSGRVQRPQCIDIPVNLSLCHGIGYQQMMLPNLLQHDSLSEVTQQAKSWVPLVAINCHPDIKMFLCSLFSPVCLDREIYPCRSLCENVKQSCLHRMLFYGFQWPEMLRCAKFPEDHDMCIRPIHDIKPDNLNCSACRHPMTYESIIDNYCRADFVMRVKVAGQETRGGDKRLVLARGKRFYKAGNLTHNERTTITPTLSRGGSCVCGALNLSSPSPSPSYFLMMGTRQEGQLTLTYLVPFQRQQKEFRRAIKAIRKDNVCNSIIKVLSAVDTVKKDKNKDDGICIACKAPVKYFTMVENYCLADFVLRVKVKGVEAREGQQALLMKKGRKNYKKGAVTRKEEKSMQPFLEGQEGCTCPQLASQTKARYLVFGAKKGEQFYVTAIMEFARKDKEFRRGMRAIRRGNPCMGLLHGTGLGLPDAASDTQPPAPSARKRNKKRRKNRKGKKGKKGRKGKKKKKRGNSDSNSA